MKEKHWIDNADSYICPVCRFECHSPKDWEGCKCPKCGFQDKDEQTMSKEKKNIKKCKDKKK